MGAASYVQASFLGGEWSPSMQGRVDYKEYRTAMNVCLNGFPTETGSWVRRPGTQFACATRQGATGRVIAYDFKQAIPYNMIFTDGFLRFTTGPSVVMTNDSQSVTAINSANPVQITTATNHGWSAGQYVMFSNLGTNNPLLQNRQFKLVTASGSTATLADGITGTNINGATLDGSQTGTVSRILEIATPYTGGLWSSLRSIATDNNGVISAVFLQSSFPPYQLTVTAQATGSKFATFSLAQAIFQDGPYFDPILDASGQANVQITPGGTTGLVTCTVTFVAWSASVAYNIGAYVLSGGVSYQSLINGNFNLTPAGNPSAWQAVTPSVAINNGLGFLGTDIGRHVRILQSSQWGWGTIQALANLISPSLAGSANIGNMTSGGGLAAAFDSVTSQASGSCAESPTGAGQQTANAYVGKNYTGASAQKIAYGTCYPSSDDGFFIPNGGTTITINLRAKQTAPANSSDGTLLGTTGTIANTTQAQTITSSDQNTAWNYVWFEILNPTNPVPIELCAEAQFFNPAGAGSAAFTLQVVSPLLNTTATTVWRLGLFSQTTGWPTVGTYHEGRLWLSGLIDNRIDGSVSNNIFTFSPTNAAGTVGDSNAISYKFNAPDVNTILWMEPDALGIICGTQGGEWLVQASAQNNPLTPTSIQAHRVTKNRCANIEPRRTEHTLAVVKRFGRKVLEYFADVFSGKLQAQNMTYYCKHLTKAFIQEIAYQQELVPILWARLGDGSLMGITYKRESLASAQPPDFMAGHRHTLGSGRTVQYIAAGPSADGNYDTLSMITSNGNAAGYQVELLTNIWEDGNALTSAWFLDNAVAPSSYINTVSGGLPGLQLNGLWHQNGLTVSVFAGGLDCGDHTISNGSVFVPFGDGVSGGTGSGLFTQAYVNTFTTLPIVVGFNYNSDGQIVRPASAAETGARNGPGFGKIRRNHNYSVNLIDTSALNIAADFSHLKALNFRQLNGIAYTALQMWQGVWWDVIDDDYSFDGMIAWRSQRMLPATVGTISGNIQTNDR